MVFVLFMFCYYMKVLLSVLLFILTYSYELKSSAQSCSPGLHSAVTTVTAITDNVPTGYGIPEISLNSERSLN